MKRGLAVAAALLMGALAAGVIAAQDSAGPAGGEAKYAVTGAMQLEDCGPWGHVAQSADGKLLYVLSTDWMRVMDAATGKMLTQMGVGNGARGICIAPAAGRGYVSDGWGQTVTVFDLKTNTQLGKLSFDHGTEAISYDPMSRHLFLAQASSTMLIPFADNIDLKTGKPDDPIDLDGTAAAMVADGQGMLYLTLVDKDAVAVVDTREMKLMTTWPLDAGARPMGISMDAEHGRLFIGTSYGIAVLSAADGHELAKLPLKNPVDETAFLDGKAFACSNNGAFTVIGQDAQGKFEIEQSLVTGYTCANMNGSNPNNAMILNAITGTIYVPAGEAPPGGGVAHFKLLEIQKK